MDHSKEEKSPEASPLFSGLKVLENPYLPPGVLLVETGNKVQAFRMSDAKLLFELDLRPKWPKMPLPSPSL
jgi:hypothetical protein